MKKLEMILKEIEKNNGRCYYVGGCVRDVYIGLEVYDYDIEVYNMSFQSLYDVLKHFGEVIANEKFYTMKLKHNPNYEFTLAREEISLGKSHGDFQMKLIENLDFKKASARRDFTINSIMRDFSTGEIIDCYNGIGDIVGKKLKHISPKFSEDALRVLRALRFSSKLGFEIDESTIELCKSMVDDLEYISTQRFSKEFNLMLNEKHVNNAIMYFIMILKDFFKIDNYDPKILNVMEDVNNYRIRQLLFFYYIKDNDLDFVLSKCVDKKRDIEAIKYLINSNMDFYEVATFFNREEVIMLFKYISDENVEEKYEKYLQLISKYNATYFIDLGYSGKEISEAIHSTITNELE